MGVKRGERIMTFTPNHIFIPVVYLGIVDTKASILLVHPDVISTALTAAAQAGFPKDRVFLFSDVPNTDINGMENKPKKPSQRSVTPLERLVFQKA
ncbi:MAG: hypothetical protein Q9183_004284 [Haloplaca sp. 2 TL-2023]